MKQNMTQISFKMKYGMAHGEGHSAHVERGVLQSMFRGYMQQFEKRLSRVEYEKLRTRYATAVSNAERLRTWQVNSGRPGENPSTDFHDLTEQIRSLGRASHIGTLHS